MVPHKPRKSAPTEYTTDNEDMIMYDVDDDELEPNPANKYAMKEYFRNNPDKYMRALTPIRFRKTTRGLLATDLVNFEPWPSDVDGTLAGTPLF
ncbi:uncharacterized protein TNCV_220361 [Trichonephila clavipes]|nr:uncharacterized protein TNCV_220361 [Trichonephila clavipes]